VSLCQHLSSIILLLTKESCELMSTLVLHHFITDQRVMWAYVNICPPSFYYWPKSHVSLCQHLSSIINISHFDLSSEITWLIETKLGWNDGCRVIFRNSSDNMTARDNLSFWLVKCKKKVFLAETSWSIRTNHCSKIVWIVPYKMSPFVLIC
jgi:hypothetical protein